MPSSIEFLRKTTIFDGDLLAKIAAILDTVPAANGVSWETVVSSDRSWSVGPARKATATALRALGLPLAQIGRVMGGKDHSTIVYYLQGKRGQAAVRA